MPFDVTTVLRKALNQLESQKSRLDRQIVTLYAALDGDAPQTAETNGTLPPASRKRGMSTAARRAVGLRMKTYWAKRRLAATKEKAVTKRPKRASRASHKKK
jgi:hypothetical protein